MRRIAALILACALALPMVSCAQKTENVPTWQEQYDLGLRYLEEGNYEEAILAFTAAIEIDPKRAEAYVGRGDTYLRVAVAQDDLKQAQTDYEMAIELDEAYVQAYLGLSDVYVRYGDVDKALEILHAALENIGNNEMISSRISELEDNDIPNELISVIGEFFLIEEKYKDKIDTLFEIYDSDGSYIIVRHAVSGVRFLETVTVVMDGEAAVIEEAELSYHKVIEDNSQIYSYVESKQVAGPLIGKKLILEGYFTVNDQISEVEGPFFEYREGEPEVPIYDLRPTGPYIFHLTGYEEVSQ